MHILLGIGLCIFGVIWLEIRRLNDSNDNDNDTPPDE